MNDTDEIHITDRSYWLNKAVEVIPVPKLKKKLTLKARISGIKSVNILEFAPDIIKTDYEIVLLAIDQGRHSIFDIHPDLKEDKQFTLKYIEQSKYISYYGFNKSIKEDEEIFYAAFKKSYSVWSSLAWESNKFCTKEHIAKLLSIDGRLISDLGDRYRKDLELAKIAIEQDFKNIFLLSKKVTAAILTDIEYCKKILDSEPPSTMYHIEPCAFEFFSSKVRSDRNFVLPYVKNKPNLLRHLGKKLKGDKDFMSQFVGASSFIHTVSDELKNDEELMLRACSLVPSATWKVGEKLKNKEFYLKLVSLNGACYLQLSEKYRLETEIVTCFLSFETISHNSEKQKPFSLLDDKILKKCAEEYAEIDPNIRSSYESYVKHKYLLNHLLKSLPNEEKNEGKKFKI